MPGRERIKRCAGNKGLIKLGKRKKTKKTKRLERDARVNCDHAAMTCV